MTMAAVAVVAPPAVMMMNDLTSRLGPKESLYKCALDGQLSDNGVKEDILTHGRHPDWLLDAIVVKYFTAPLLPKSGRPLASKRVGLAWCWRSR